MNDFLHLPLDLSESAEKHNFEKINILNTT